MTERGISHETDHFRPGGEPGRRSEPDHRPVLPPGLQHRIPGSCLLYTSDLSINPAHAANALESLETYIISKKLLLDMVDYCAAHNIHNFSRGVLLPRLSTLKVLPYLHRGYVARFQSVADYFQHSMDLLDPAVRADLFDPDRPIRTKDQSNPSTYYGPDAKSRCV